MASDLGLEGLPERAQCPALLHGIVPFLLLSTCKLMPCFLLAALVGYPSDGWSETAGVMGRKLWPRAQLLHRHFVLQKVPCDSKLHPCNI